MDLRRADGRSLHCYDSGDAGGLTVFWHHGSPNAGMPPEPLFPAAGERGIRWISCDLPGYMSSTARAVRGRVSAERVTRWMSCGRRGYMSWTARPDRDKASAAADAAAVADALGVGEFA